MSEQSRSELQPFGEALWTMSGDDVRMMTIPFTTRMTVVRLAGGELWVHSPVAPSSSRRATVEALGPIAHVVAPNRIHSLGVAPWKSHYPSAVVWVSPRFTARHPDLPADRILQDRAPEAWAREIEQHVFAGSVFLDEVVFFHRPSGTLIVTDLIQRHDRREQSWWWRAVKGWAGILGPEGGTSRDLRWTFRDRAAARRSAERILAWNFDRLVIAHGACVERGAREVVARAFAWLG